jgi:SAM-dependent methyltransferase
MTLPAEAYGAFAYAYDQSLGREFFATVRTVLEDLLDRYPAGDGATHLDVACGTGLVTEYFSRSGYRSLGIDASPAMLAVGQRRGGLRVAGDMRALPLRGSFSRVTCVYDSLNHLLQRSELVATFSGISSVMSDESLFFFDMNHPAVYPRVWGMAEPYVSRGAGYHLEIATSFSKFTKKATGKVSGWAFVGGKRVEIAETHLQRAYSEKEILRSLEEGGLAPVEVFGFDPFESGEVSVGAAKLFFVARRL